MIPHETRSYLGLGLLVHALQSSVDPVEIDDLQRSIVRSGSGNLNRGISGIAA